MLPHSEFCPLSLEMPGLEFGRIRRTDHLPERILMQKWMPVDCGRQTEVRKGYTNMIE